MATVGQQLLQPESGWRRYDDTNSLIKYNGNWTTFNSSNYYNNTIYHTKVMGDNITFLFKGTKVRIIAAKNGIPTAMGSSNATIKIDGIEETISFYNPTVLYQLLIYEKIDLEDKIHRIELINNENNYIWLDAIDIDDDGELIRYDYFETDYLEPMRKYGVAWFGFDETSGNTYDKLGNDYVGTVKGGTRVDGWNGEGSALGATSINQIVKFNNPIIPSNEFSIRFKIKCLPNTNTNGQYFLSTFTSSSDQRGLFVAVHDIGYLSAGISTSTGATTWSDYSIIRDNGLLIADNQWHDILISRGQDFFTIYVINRNKEYKTISTGSSSYHGNLNLLNRNDLVAQAGRFLNGQIDDLQIYNKALSPSDFTQKRLVVKTTDNKNLVLSPTSTRIKEIPNTAEYMMLAQGGVIKEIDSAVDNTPIDFTKTTTEYEIVTNNRTPLGKARLFTIPIGSDFKTAMIEDNY